MLKPAVEGSGVAVGGAVLSCHRIMVVDVNLNHLVQNTPINIVRVPTVEGLKLLKRAEEAAALVRAFASDLALQGNSWLKLNYFD